jgi:hypothetical protein
MEMAVGLECSNAPQQTYRNGARLIQNVIATRSPLQRSERHLDQLNILE